MMKKRKKKKEKEALPLFFDLEFRKVYREFRLKKKMNSLNIGKHLGVHGTYFYNIELGRRPTPPLYLVKKIEMLLESGGLLVKSAIKDRCKSNLWMQDISTKVKEFPILLTLIEKLLSLETEDQMKEIIGKIFDEDKSGRNP